MFIVFDNEIINADLIRGARVVGKTVQIYMIDGFEYYERFSTEKEAKDRFFSLQWEFFRKMER